MTQVQDLPRAGVVTLAATDDAILEHLARNRNRIVSAQELIDAVRPEVITPSALAVRIHRARKRHGYDVIRTVRGAGYQFGLPPTEERPLLQTGDLKLYSGHRVQHGTEAAFLHPADTPLLACLICLAGRLATYDTLARTAGIENGPIEWGRLRRLISVLESIGADGLLVPVYRRGYRLAARDGVRRVLGVELDRCAGEARVDGMQLDLHPGEFDVLDRLVMAPRRSFSREDFADIAADEELTAMFARLQDAIGADRLVADGSRYRLAVERFGLPACESLVLDPDALSVQLGTREMQLVPSHVRLLAELVRAGGNVILTQQLVTAAGVYRDELPRLQRTVRRLGHGAELIEHPRIGYRLAVELLDEDHLN